MGRKKQAKRMTEQQLKKEKTGPTNKEWLVINLAMFSAVLVLIILSLTSEEGTKDYYRSQNALFVMVVISSLSFIFREEVNKHMFLSIRKLFKEKQKLNMYELGDILLAFAYLISFLSIIIVDFSFLDNYGLKISAVVAVNLYVMLKAFVFNKPKN